MARTTKNKDANDFSFPSTSGRENNNKENRGRGRRREHGDRGGRDNISQTMKMATLVRIKYYSCGKYGHNATECCNKKRDEEANLTLTQDQEPALMLVEKMPNLLMLNEAKVMANLLTKGEDRVETNMWYLDNGVSNHMTGDRTKFKELDEKLIGNVKLAMDQLYRSKVNDQSCSSARKVTNI